jgi:hypothetical protein
LTVTVRLPIVRVPVLVLVDVFAVTLKETVLLPVLLLLPDTVIQPALLATFQLHEPPAVTVELNVAAAADGEWVIGNTVTLQLPD